MGEHLQARDLEEMVTRSNGQDWSVSWHPGASAPAGRSHGAAGICVTGDAQLVLISHDGAHWGFPAGRPEGDESPLETLRREVLEEACAVVGDARVLDYSRSRCLRGHERGLVLVRSYWWAEVELLPWQPRFEITHRRIIPVTEATDVVRDPDEAATRIALRALDEAGVE
ncbi:NUDIX domain-containing protein [Polymorphospora sp. NPDC050346]|uniref:NUDIX hydrolase n=1 Tax=Polymorphospora sp. NPDC050346 TaxID=3155780 RepID=UPI0034064628